jgi:hypothetical protein
VSLSRLSRGTLPRVSPWAWSLGKSKMPTRESHWSYMSRAAPPCGAVLAAGSATGFSDKHLLKRIEIVVCLPQGVGCLRYEQKTAPRGGAARVWPVKPLNGAFVECPLSKCPNSEPRVSPCANTNATPDRGFSI